MTRKPATAAKKKGAAPTKARKAVAPPAKTTKPAKTKFATVKPKDVKPAKKPVWKAVEPESGVIAAAKPAPAATAPQVDALLPQVQAFVDAYIRLRNGKQAAIEAGYSPKTAESQASRLLRDAKVRAAVDAGIARAAEKAEISTTRVLREVGRMVFSDIRNLFDENGALKSLDQLDDDTAAAVASVEVDALYEGYGKDRVQIGVTQKVKFYDKNPAAEKLMRHLGMFGKDNAQKVDPLAELLALVAMRGQKLPIKH